MEYVDNAKKTQNLFGIGHLTNKSTLRIKHILVFLQLPKFQSFIIRKIYNVKELPRHANAQNQVFGQSIMDLGLNEIQVIECPFNLH
jgi:hypothetical protein